jgi:arylsulfatase A-like enzyme
VGKTGYFTVLALTLLLFGSFLIKAQRTKSTQSSDLVDRSVLPIPETPFRGKIARTFEDSKEDWPRRVKAPANAPNVLIILLDDVGFGHLGSYGGLSETPNMDWLARNGLIYNRFNTTAICSASRAALLAGRNHHSIGLGSHALTAMGFPGYNAHVPESAGPLSKILKYNGYTTYALGKWDHTPLWEVSTAGPFVGWPSGDGFDHYYGFMAADANNMKSTMWADHTATDPWRGKPDYDLTEDMADRAIYWITAQASVTPDRPFMMFFATPGMHAPHQAPQKYRDMYKGKFDMGYDKARETIYERQLKSGVIPAGTKLSPRDTRIPAWDSLTPEEKKLYARQMEAYAAQMTHTDEQIGRLIATLKRIGQLDNTLIFVTSDNGASGEGGLAGSHNEMRVANGQQTSVSTNMKYYDDWGTEITNNHYSAGWALAGNTPFQYYKQTNFNGGIGDPLIVFWPKGIQDAGKVRTQYSHIIDIAPTVLEAVGVPAPKIINGTDQLPMDGISLIYSFNSPSARDRRTIQYYEMFGNRAIYKDGWKAVTLHGNRPPWIVGGTFPFDKDVWELYHVADDFSESTNLAAQHPQKLEELKKLFDEQAFKYHVYPLYDDLAARIKKATEIYLPTEGTFTYYTPGARNIAEASAAPIKNKDHTVTAYADIPQNGAEGVLVCSGGYMGGYTFYMKGGRLHYTYNSYNEEYSTISSNKPVPTGRVELRYDFKITGPHQGKVTLYINGEPSGEGDVRNTMPGKFSLSETFDVGADTGSPVDRHHYTSPFEFTGNLDKVVITVSKSAAGEKQTEEAEVGVTESQ